MWVRRYLCLLLVLVVALPVLTGSLPSLMPGAVVLGGSDTAPEQRSGTADGSTHEASADATRDNRALPKRDQPRPQGAVADHAPPLPEVKRPSDEQQRVTPKVNQPRNQPAIDPGAVERPGDRTDRTQTFENPDGSRTLRAYSSQANVRQPDGSWLPVDLTLTPADGRLEPKVSPVDLTTAASSGDASLVRLGFGDDRWMSYGMRDAADVRGEARGGEVTYRGVQPGVDLKLTATRTGVKEDLILASAAASMSYAFNLTLNRLQPRISESGAVELFDGETLVATIPAGFADDAAGVRSTGVRYALEKTGSNTWTLRLDLDRDWLRAPGRVFPVTIDPSVGRFNGDADDTYVRSNKRGDPSTVELEVGRVQGQPASRAYLHFGGALNALRNQYIVGATLNVDNIYSPNCSPRSVTVFEVTQSWGGTQSWPGAAVGQALASNSFAHGGPAGSACSASAWVPFRFDADLMTRWTHGAALGHGLSLRASDETDPNGKRFASFNSANPPYLDVRYSSEGASFEVTSVLLPNNVRAGTLSAKVTNLGSSTWPAAGPGINFGYIVKQGNTVIRTRKDFYASVAPMQTHHFVDLPIDPLPPGDYDVLLTMFTAQGEDFRVAHEISYGEMQLTVTNQKPTSNYQQPGNGAVVESRTPTLYAEGIDGDNWPGRILTYKFRICTDAELTADCVETDWTNRSFAPDLRWNKTYYWGVKTHDTVDETDFWVGPLALTTRVPQPQITSHLAGSPDTIMGPGLDPGIGNYSATVTDASVSTVGPDLTISRTYNSLDPRRDTAFGVGWASRLDMRLRPDDDNSGNVVITYPTGRQARYGRNPDGTFASPTGSTVDLVYTSNDGVYTLRDNSGSRWRFDVLGRLVTIIDPAGLTETLTYDTSDRVASITNDTSNRTLTLTWLGNRVSTVATEAPEAGAQPLVWSYTYEGERLTKACSPGAAPNCTTYGHTTGSHYRSSVVDDSPKAYWRLGETSGNTFANVTARRDGENSGTQNNVVLGTGGALGGTADKAATFDGNSSYVTLPEKMTTETMSVSVEMWFKTTSHGTLISYADQQFPAAGNQSTPILYVGTDGLLYGGFTLHTMGGPRQVVSTQQVNDDQWHHAVLSTAINTQTMYLDGQKVGDLAGFIDHKQQGKLTLGAGSGKDWPATNGGNFHFNGSIDEVAVYRHTLGSLAVRQHFGARAQIDQLTTITLPQDNRQFAKLTYDDINDRVSTLLDHTGRSWTLDVPRVQDSTTTVVLRGPPNFGDWTYTFDIDNGGRLTSRTHEGAIFKWEYNTAGFLAATVDESNLRTEQTSDVRGNVLSSKTCRATDSCNTRYFSYFQTSDSLDPRRDKLTSSSDARSSGPDDTRYRTTYGYDTAGRSIKVTHPVPEGHSVAPTEINTYATGTESAVGGGTVPAGLLIKETGRRNQVVTNSYFANGDLAEVAGPTGLRVRYTYDAIGRQKTITQGNAGGGTFGTSSYEYTPRSQVSKITEPAVTNPVTGVTHQEVNSYLYDGNGNLLESKVSDGRGGDAARTTTISYDLQDRPAVINYADGGKETHSYQANGLTKLVTDARGTIWTSQFDERGLLLAHSAAGPGVDPQNPSSTGLLLESHVYDPAGKLRSSDDAIGRRTTFSYYDDGLLAKVVRNGYQGPNGTQDVVIEDHSYDPAGNPTQVVHAGGRKTVQTYDAIGFLTSSTFDPDGVKRATKYQRDADGNATRVESRGAADPNRVEATAYVYDDAGQVTREDAFLNPTTTFTTKYDRDERGLLKATTDRRLLTTTYTYDATGALVTTTLPATEVWVNGVRTPTFNRVTTQGRNTFGEVSHTKDGNGAVTAVEYDGRGRATKTTLPDYTPPGGQKITPVYTTEYDRSGNAVKQTDPLNRITTHEYDPYDRVIATTLPQVADVPSVVKTGYNRVGEVLSRTRPSGAQTRFTYDELGRQITETQVERSSGSPVFFTTTTRFDLADNPVEVRNPVDAVTKTTFNAAGEPLTSTDPTDRKTSYTYDIAGRLATTTDPAGLATATTYDLLGRATRTANLVGGVEKRATSATFDAADNLVSETSAEGRSRTLVRDELNRIVQQVEKVNATKSITVSFGYDKLGNRSRFVDGKGNATIQTFTPQGWPESAIEPATTAHPNAADRTWTSVYDAVGHEKQLTKPGGVSVTREFDAQGRVKLERGTGTVATTDRTFGYDLDGRLIRTGGPRGDSTYTYDDRSNLLESSGAAGSTTYTYNGDGTVATREDVTGKATFTYDKVGRLTNVIDPLSGRTVDYGYDQAGRVSLVSDRAVSSWTSRWIDYDELGRKASDRVQQTFETGTPPQTVLGTEYGYDRDDKMKSKKVTDRSGAANNTYDYDGSSRLTSWTGPTGATVAYGWDDAGNRTTAGSATFTYDQRNRLLSGEGATYTYTARGTLATTVQNGQTKNASYDAFDRKVADGIVNYRYDSLNRVADRNNVAFQYAGKSNEAVADGSRLISRLPNGSAFADKATASTAKGKMIYSDGHNDVIGRYVGASVDGRRTFDPFGKVTSSTGDASPLGYQGDWTDGDTGAVNMTARWYSPGAGGFTSRDDWTVDPMPSAKGNRYQYGDNDPIGNSDPTGHDALSDYCDWSGGSKGGKATRRGVWGGAFLDFICGTDLGGSDPACRGYEGFYPNGYYCPRKPGPSNSPPMPVECSKGTKCYDGVGSGDRSRPTGPGGGGKDPKKPTIRKPQPPPPPKWWIDGHNQLVRPPPGDTTIPRPPTTDTNPPPDTVKDKNDQETKDNTETTEDDSSDSDGDWDLRGDYSMLNCLSGNMEYDEVYNDPVEKIKDWKGYYYGKRAGRPPVRATGGVVCLMTTAPYSEREPWTPVGYVKDQHHRCHIVGHQLNGGEGVENIVPCDAEVNTPDMSGVEREIAKEVQSQVVFYRVTMHYPDEYAAVPDYFDITAIGQDRNWVCFVRIHNPRPPNGYPWPLGNHNGRPTC